MNEVVLTEVEEVIGRAINTEGGPTITMTRDYIYFNVTLCKLFPCKFVTISRSGPYIIFRESTSKVNSFAVSYRNSAAQVGSTRIAQLLNPDRQKHTYPAHPVKGGGWCIKVK